MKTIPIRNILVSMSLATMLATPAVFASPPDTATDEATPALQQVRNASITGAIKAKLIADHRTRGFDINVDTVNQGEVTLRGTAPSVEGRLAAAELASMVAGVKSVQNDLIIAEPGSVAARSAPPATASQHLRRGAESGAETAGDAWITAKVKAALLADREVRARDIKVTTEDGVVHLEGEVDNRRIEARVVEIAAGIEGVRRVDIAQLKRKS